jgi:hypothetical protein
VSKFTFKTPKAGHFIELSSSGVLGTESTGEFKVFGYDVIRVVRDDHDLTWRLDARTPVEWLDKQKFYPTSMATGWNLDADQVLGKSGALELKFHVSTPLSPYEKGVGIVLIFIYSEKNGLAFDSSLRKSQQWVFAENGVLKPRIRAPQWLATPEAPWIAEDGGDKRAPSRGNRLLSADRFDNSSLKTNLVHIDPGLEGSKASDYSFSFNPVKTKTGWEVISAFDMARDFGFPAGVSDYALSLQVQSRSGTPFSARGMKLRCTMTSGRDGWDLEWQGLPGSGKDLPPDTFTLESLSQALLGTHALGLATTRSRNRLSLVPTWLRTADPNGIVNLRFSLPARTLALEDVKFRSIRLAQALQVIRFNCGGAVGATGSAWEFDVRASQSPDKKEREVFLAWTLSPGPAPASYSVGAGSVLLTMSKFNKGTLTLGCSLEGAVYRRAPLEADLRLEFDEANYAALSMDPELGFETLSSVVSRPRPWTIDLRDDAAIKEQTCRLVIQERATREQSRMLRMDLTLINSADVTTDVVLVDSSPMTLVRVSTRARINGGEILAEYVDDSDQAPEWRFFSDAGSITVIMPPQGIGEEMIKGWIFRRRGTNRVAVPVKDELFDFRLTPPARLTLDATDVDSALAEAPWSLRRLMGRRLGTTGVKLEGALFELFYGLQAQVKTKGLRVAELDGFVGRVPFADALWRHYLRGKDALEKSIEEGYALDASRWMVGLWNRPSWWRVYTDIANRGPLVLDKGVEYRLRPTRETADPFAVENYASAEGVPTNPPAPREPLRGGVDWAFQSRNIYEELKRKPTSSSGSIEGLAFGPLGGEGAQTAAFNNGKTLIITNSRQGRLDAVTLIRVGRIAMTWNKARHVIVYERTTRRAPRYVGADTEPTSKQDDLESQPEFLGIAALRKVREYVEITEPRRRYPDIATQRAIGGPLLQSTFSTTTVPVKSTWGRDVRDGFAIALRGPVAPAEVAMFPDPQVFLGFARAPGKGEGLVSQRITTTDKLIFFSSTRDEDGGDTDQWPAWPDIDYPLLAPPRPPKLPFSSSFSDRTRQPNAAAIELGMGPFTFGLMPSEEAVNLMHGRQEPGLEARISNLSLARGLPERKDSPMQKAGDVFADSNSQLVDGIRELAAELRERVAKGDTRPLSEVPALHADISALLERLNKTAGDIKGVALPANPSLKTFGWEQEQKSRGEAYITGVTTEAANLGAQLQQQASVLEGNLADARGEAAVAVEAVAQQARRKIGEAGFVAELALNAASGLVVDLENRFSAHLRSISTRLLRDIDVIEAAIARGDSDLAGLDRVWRSSAGQIGAEVRQLMDVLEQTLDGELGRWFSRLKNNGQETLISKFQQGVADSLPAISEWVDRWTDNLPPFDLQLPDFINLRRFVADAFTRTLAEALLQEVKKLIAGLQPSLNDWDKGIESALKELDKWVKAMRVKLDAAADVQRLQQELLDAAKPLADELLKLATAVTDGLNAKLVELVNVDFSGLQGSLDALEKYPAVVEKFIADLRFTLTGTVGDVERQLQLTIRDLQAYAQASARQVEELARAELGNAVAIAKSSAEAGLEAIRILAEGPVTDAIRVTREQVGYYYDKALDTLDLTRASAVFNDLGEDVLNALSASLPFGRIRDRLLPMLDNFAVRDLFPDFCGIKLAYLLPDLDVPLDGNHEYGWLQFQHGFDKERLSAWAKVSIDKRFDDDGTLFDLGPIKMRLLKPRFTAMADITIEKDGQRRRITKGKLDADFELSLNDKPMVTLADGSLTFDERGELDFNFDAEKLILADELQFVSDAVKALMPDMEGLTITPLLPAGINAELSLPLPDIGTGAFTLTGVTLNARLGLVVGDGFEIRTGLWLSKPERPFGMAVLFLGGGGWFGIEASYKPPSRFVTRVSIGISAGAFVAINFGFAYGSAGILFTVGVDFYRDWSTGAGTTAISLGLLVWGEFSVMGIASASLRLTLTITYMDGGMVGTGTLSLRIRICWCYTLRVSRSVQQVFSKPSGSSSSSGSRSSASTVAAQPAMAVLGNAAGAAVPAKVEPAPAADYGKLPAVKPARAVSDHFDTLAI